jgi:hypothetical protein
VEGVFGDGVVDPLVDLVVAEFVQAGEVAETAAAKGAELRWWKMALVRMWVC